MSRPMQPIALPRPAVSVWATGQSDGAAQLTERGYLPGTARDTACVPPAVAERAITAYTRPGDAVLDPDCGSGTVLVEALRAGRHAVGITGQRCWWSIARANVTAVKREGACTDGMVLDGAPDPAFMRLAGLTGAVDLLLTTLRTTAAADVPARPWPECRSADDRPVAPSPTRLATIVGRYRPLLRPGGYVVVIVRPRRHRGYLLNLTDEALVAGRAAGLVPVERCIALMAELRDDRLVVHASMAQRRIAADRARAVGHPISLTAHQDVLVFRAPAEAAQAAAIRPPVGGIPHRALARAKDGPLLPHRCAA